MRDLAEEGTCDVLEETARFREQGPSPSSLRLTIAERTGEWSR